MLLAPFAKYFLLSTTQAVSGPFVSGAVAKQGTYD